MPHVQSLPHLKSTSTTPDLQLFCKFQASVETDLKPLGPPVPVGKEVTGWRDCIPGQTHSFWWKCPTSQANIRLKPSEGGCSGQLFWLFVCITHRNADRLAKWWEDDPSNELTRYENMAIWISEPCEPRPPLVVSAKLWLQTSPGSDRDSLHNVDGFCIHWVTAKWKAVNRPACYNNLLERGGTKGRGEKTGGRGKRRCDCL